LIAAARPARADTPDETDEPPRAAAGTMLYVPSDVYNAAPDSGVETAADVEGARAALARARQAVDAGQVSEALREACRALVLDPDHADARRLLGYRRVGGQWAGGYAERMLESGHQWRREFGWIKTEHAAKYDAGLRPWGAGWISSDEDARRHDTIEHGWTVRTDHFLVTTNIDRAAAADLATRLETLYQLWRQCFGELAMAPEALKAQLDGKQSAGYLRKPFRVIYHRNRDEYNASLAARQPQIGITLGIYFDADRQSHFFAGAGQDPGTIAHEAVHQFFYESAPRPTRALAATANVWAVEGAACYFESLVQREGAGGRAYVIGGPEAGRLPAARHRRLVDDYYVPLAELAGLGMVDLQHRPDIARLYSQSAGLAAFFMDYQDGVYRNAFRELLALVYAGRDAAYTLVKLTGKSFDQLDRDYLTFIKGLPPSGAPSP
jgi:hypothetical protein